MNLVIGKTARGFERADFQDNNGVNCSLQQSGTSSIRLGVDEDRMHLGREHVEALLPCLQRWLESGSFVER